MANIFGDENVYIQEDVKYASNNCCLINIEGADNSFAMKITSYTLSMGERVQIINCLNDKNHLIPLGKDVTRLSLSGLAFKEDVKTVYDWYQNNRAYKEKKIPVHVLIGGDANNRAITVSGTLTGFVLNFSAENIGIGNYTISLVEVI